MILDEKKSYLSLQDNIYYKYFAKKKKKIYIFLKKTFF